MHEFEWLVEYRLPELQSSLSQLNATELESYVLKIWNGEFECLLAGLYSVHIKRWTKYFSSTHLLILNGEDMMKNPGPEYVKLQNFLGVSQQFRLEDWEKHRETGHFCLHPPQNRTALFCQVDGRRKGRTRGVGQNAMKPNKDIMSMLQKFYKPYNEQLYEILNINFNWV